MELAVIGGPEFVLGFQLTGIRTIVEVPDSEEDHHHDQDKVTRQFLDLKDVPEVGIIITDERTMGRVHEHERYLLERSAKPLILVLSATGGGSEDLRAMIRQAIGIDILKDSEK